MRIGVYPGTAPVHAGGAFTVVDDLWRAFIEHASRSSHSFVAFGVCGPSRHNIEYHELPEMPRPIERTRRAASAIGRKLRNPTLPLESKTTLARHVDRSGVDLLWSLSPSASGYETPLITTVWDLQHRRQPFFPEVGSGGIWARREAFYGKTLRRATTIITGTATGKAEIERFYGIAPERIVVIQLPTPTDALEAGPGASTFAEDAPYLFYPAQFWPHKNHVNLLKALDILHRRGHKIRLKLSGSDQGNEAHVRSVISELGLEDWVDLLGFVVRDDLLRLYRGAFALSFVSFFGPDNLPPLEAFALGCPVIAADVPGAREQLGDAAIFVDPSSPKAIADAVEQLMDGRSDRTTLVGAGLERARIMTADRFVERVMDLIERFAAVRAAWPSSEPGPGPTIAST